MARSQKCARARYSLSEHVHVVQGGEPVRVGGRVVVAPAEAVALDEGSCAEFLQTRSRRNQRLTAALRTRVGVLKSQI